MGLITTSNQTVPDVHSCNHIMIAGFSYTGNKTLFRIQWRMGTLSGEAILPSGDAILPFSFVIFF